MKTVIAAMLLLLAGVATAETQPYVEYKSELRFTDTRYDATADTLRFGLKFDKWYAELGATTSTFGTGLSTEIGYKFKLAKRWELKGKWEGGDVNPLFKSKLETEVRYYFK